MSDKIHLLIPMSGQGVRYHKAGYTQPKPLVPVNDIPMIMRTLENYPLDWVCHFVLAENHRQTELPTLLKSLRPTSTISYVEPHALGPGRAIEKGLETIPKNEKVFVSYCDYGMVWDSAQFVRFINQSQCDACVVCYRGFHAHYLNPVTYAYCRMDGERVVEVREKGSFTETRENEYASSGGYYFRTAQILHDALQFQTQNNLSLNGEYYTSLTVEALLKFNPHAHVRVFEIPGFFQWGTPQDLKRFEYWEKTFSAYNRNAGYKLEIDQVLMPMAGLGSRFTSITDNPKPLIPVGTKPMYIRALETLPRAKTTVLVALNSFSSRLLKNEKTKTISLETTPSGQALSTMAGVSALTANQDVVVSSCDHGIVLNPQAWKAFRSQPNCDAAIFTMKGYPGAQERPQAYAYVVPQNESEKFPKVKSVSVKKPVSETPDQDHVLVGTFWFRTADILRSGIEDLQKKDIRINGELYLDSVFEVLMQQSLNVRMIPLDGYIGWGDPDSLAEALYWEEIFCCRTIEARPRFPGVQESSC